MTLSTDKLDEERSDVANPSTPMDTITLISDQEEIICADPVYHDRIDVDYQTTFSPSCITALPRSDYRLATVCYVRLMSGQKPVLVTPQSDGSIQIGGAYVDSIGEELGV